MANGTLSPKHRVFVKEYIKDRNAARSYVAAGYSSKGAAQAAHKLLSNADVKLAVEKGLAKLAAKLDISAERTLARLAEFAYQPLTAKELKNSAGMNALRATENLAKHFKLLTDVQEHTGRDGGPIAFIALPPNGSEALGLVSPANPAPVPAASDENDGEPAND